MALKWIIQPSPNVSDRSTNLLATFVTPFAQPPTYSPPTVTPTTPNYGDRPWDAPVEPPDEWFLAPSSGTDRPSMTNREDLVTIYKLNHILKTKDDHLIPTLLRTMLAGMAK